MVGAGVLLLLGALVACAQPTFLFQPESRSVSLGADVILYAEAFGPMPVSYQWRKNGVELPGQTMEVLVFSPVQPSDAGDYDVVASDLSGSVTSAVATVSVDGTFTKITTGPIVNDFGFARGGAWGDYDNDGFLDLFVAHDRNTNNALFHNNGDGTFTRLFTGPVVNDGAASYGGAWADVNNDGLLDLFVPNYNNQNDGFYVNRGGGTFVRSNTALIATDGRSTAGAAWGDADNDGRADLVTANLPMMSWPNFTAGAAFFYQNQGNGLFVRPASQPGSEESSNLLATFFGTPSWADFDNDGRLDLFLARYNDRSSLLYRNLGSNQFARVVGGPLAEARANASGGAWGDYDNDGFLDLYVVNGFSGEAETNALYRNNGDGSFTRVTEGDMAEHVGVSGGAVWGDYDNDGYLDLFVTETSGDNALYHNRGDGTFTRLFTGSPVNDGGASRGCAWADYDNDGFLDLFVANDDQGNFLYRNNGNSNAWLVVGCEGRASNRAGLGAKVRVGTVIGGTNRWQLREISGGMTFGSQPLLAHFGLADATNVDTVKVEWPSGAVQELYGVAVRQRLHVIEPACFIEPRNPGAALGAPFTLSLTGTNGAALLFQWRLNGADLPDATNALLVLDNVQTNHLGWYSVALRDSAGTFLAVTPPVLLRVGTPPTFTAQPQPTNQSVSLGVTLSFSAALTGSDPLFLQWHHNGAPIPDATNATLVLTNIQVADAGTYFLLASNFVGVTPSQVVMVDVDPTFTKILAGSVPADGGASYGAAWVDLCEGPFSGLMVVNASGNDEFLYQNDGHGGFTKILPSGPGTIVSDRGDSMGVAVGDYDNDGRDDVYVANNNSQTNGLYHNECGGAFTKITNNVLATNRASSYSAAWADYDRDGWLDLFLASSPTVQLWHNEGHGAFSRVTDTVLTAQTGQWRGGAWADYDNDGDPDLYLANGNQINVFLRNNGDGTFAKVTEGVIATDRGNGWGVAWGDYNNDGFLDLYLAVNDTGFLYRNNGDGSFARVADAALATRGGQSRGCAWADYDNDGHLDLFAAHSTGANFLFHNNGDGSFSRVLTGSIATDTNGGKGCVWGDIDDDGFADLFVATYGQKNFLYRNNGNGNHWLKVKVVGTLSNRSALGAKVRVLAVIGGAARWQMRELSSGDGLGSQVPIAMFGLGDATNALMVRVEWPSGVVRELQNVAANQSLTVTETSPRIELSAARILNGQFEFQLSGPAGSSCVIETSTNLQDWLPWLTVTNGAGPQTLSHPGPAGLNQCYFRAVQR